MALPYTAPPPELAVELDEVRSDALALVEILSQINAPLPKAFPREAMVELASALHKLPLGTARGCLRPLGEAQSQLAAIRSQFILHDHLEQIPQDEIPPLLRGEPLDQRLRSLMSSVSTALQTANRLAVEEPESQEPEPSSKPPNDSSTAHLIRRSMKAQQELEEEKEELEALHIKSEPADTLSRRLTDAAVLSQLGRGELRLPRIVAARLKRIAQSLQDYPALVQRAAELVTSGSHIADYLHEKWSALETRIFQAGTTTIREVAEDISNYAKRLEAARKDAGPQKAPEDFDLEQATTMIHMGSSPPAHWKPLIRYLPLKNRRLRKLDGLSGLTNLRELTRLSVQVGDISLLEGLTSLEHLSLSFTQASNLQPIAKLRKLNHLSLMHTNISDLSPLTELNLRHLDIDGTNVVDLNPLKSMSTLKTLDVRRTKVASLSPISELKNLETIYVGNTPVSDISPLSRMNQLTTLFAGDTRITDLVPLANLTALTSLNIAETAVADLTPLSGLTELEALYLEKTKVRNLNPLSKLQKLRYLDIGSTSVSDLSPLANLTSLISLHIADTPVADLSPLAKLKKLWFLDLSRTKVTDLTPLGGTPELSVLQFAKTAIQNFDVLIQIRSLRSILVSGDQFDRIPPELAKRGVRIAVAT